MITRVYGKADNFELVFTEDGGAWSVLVPADLEDGKYVVELYAEDSYGFTSYFTAILYMFDGKAVLKLNEDDICFGMHGDDLAVLLLCEQEINMVSDEIYLNFLGGDTVGEWYAV